MTHYQNKIICFHSVFLVFRKSLLVLLLVHLLRMICIARDLKKNCHSLCCSDAYDLCCSSTVPVYVES